jgi:hypothetical protein
VIEVFAQHHECSLPKDKVYGFRELVPQWKENLVVNYKRSDLEVFLDVAKLDLFESKKHGGIACSISFVVSNGIGRSREVQRLPTVIFSLGLLWKGVSPRIPLAVCNPVAKGCGLSK